MHGGSVLVCNSSELLNILRTFVEFLLGLCSLLQPLFEADLLLDGR